MTLGALLRQMRKQRRLTQTQLAELAGVTQPTISRWENDYERPNPLEMKGLGHALQRRIAEREYLEVLLPELVRSLLLFGEVPAQGHQMPPSDLAVERGGWLVATPFLLETAQTVDDVRELLTRWLHLGQMSEGGTDASDIVACKVMAGEVHANFEATTQLTNGYLDIALQRDPACGPLQSNLEGGVLRPLLPRAVTPGTPLAIGRFIPVPRRHLIDDHSPRSQDLLDDPVHAAVMVLATISRFPSCAMSNARILDSGGDLMLQIENHERSWTGPLHLGVMSALGTAGFVCLTPLRRDAWAKTIRLAVDELVGAGLLHVRGPCVEVSELFWSTVASDPAHKLNRGEKRARAAVSNRFFGVVGGELHA